MAYEIFIYVHASQYRTLYEKEVENRLKRNKGTMHECWQNVCLLFIARNQFLSPVEAKSFCSTAYLGKNLNICKYRNFFLALLKSNVHIAKQRVKRCKRGL